MTSLKITGCADWAAHKICCDGDGKWQIWNLVWRK